MHPSRSLAIALVAVCAVAVAGCGKKPPPAPPPETGAAYVALGDSFTAASGYGPFEDRICRRADDDYPALVAEKAGLTLDDVSCGGAGISNLTQAQVITGEGTRQAQLNAGSADTELVTVGLGLNDPVNDTDVTLASVLTDLCVPKKGKLSDLCTAYLQLPDKNMSDAVDDMAEQVGAGLDRIRAQAPDARIIFVGYPRVLPDVGSCRQVPLPVVALNRLRSTLKQANAALSRIAEKRHVEYVDMFTASKGHDACSAEPWVNGYKTRKGEAFAFHPYKAYHRAVADKVAALLEKQKPQA